MCSLGMLHAVGSISSSEKMGMGGEEKEQEEKEENAKNVMPSPSLLDLQNGCIPLSDMAYVGSSV